MSKIITNLTDKHIILASLHVLPAWESTPIDDGVFGHAGNKRLIPILEAHKRILIETVVEDVEPVDDIDAVDRSLIQDMTPKELAETAEAMGLDPSGEPDDLADRIFTELDVVEQGGSDEID